MPVDTDAIIKLIRDVAGQREVRQTIKGSMRGTAIAAAITFAGGVLLGPAGLAVGGAVGGLTGYAATRDTFKSIADVLDDLPYDKKRRIADEVNNIMIQLDITDLAEVARYAIMVGTVVETGSITPILLNRFIEQVVPVVQRELMG